MESLRPEAKVPMSTSEAPNRIEDQLLDPRYFLLCSPYMGARKQNPSSESIYTLKQL